MNATRKAKILIADDDERSRKLIIAVLQNHRYVFETAGNGREALEKVRDFSPDMVFLDVVMPEIDGLEVCRRLKEDPKTRHIPVVIVTALEDRESRIQALNYGANDFLIKPINSAELAVRAQNLFKIKEFDDFLRQHNKILESKVNRKTKELQDAFQQLTASRDKLKESYLDTIYRLTTVIELKDEGTATHVKRVGLYCRRIAEKLGWKEKEQEQFFYSSPMHDIGKIGVPIEILLKKTKLTEEEAVFMRMHTVIGGRILHGATSEYLEMAEQIALTHHEKWNGSGYPRGLRCGEIPLVGRIMTLVDQYDTLRSQRSYKPSMSHAKACRILVQGDEKTVPEHFDPSLLTLFNDCHREFEEIYDQYRSDPIEF
jgi:putative two-component system response regulator